jgi:hypothetical protein
MVHNGSVSLTGLPQAVVGLKKFSTIVKKNGGKWGEVEIFIIN